MMRKSLPLDPPVRADVCLGADWFATTLQRRPGVPMQALSHLVGLGSHLVNSMMLFGRPTGAMAHAERRAQRGRRQHHRVD